MPVSVPLPWRSVWLPRAAVFIAIVSGLPLYLQSPHWCDITLYDVAARNLLNGGTHYRDIFDTNLPGFVWLLTGLRWLFGYGPIVVHVADLCVVIGVVALIDRLAKWAGASRASRWWALAGVAFLYPFASEMTLTQRDTWMALPALGAVALRARRIVVAKERELSPASSSVGKSFRDSMLEGLLWGLAVWLKPHVVLMAAGVWLFTIRRLNGGQHRSLSLSIADLTGNIAGGLLAGAGGIAWLIGSGTWPYFVTMLTEWDAQYASLLKEEYLREQFSFLSSKDLYWFPPWSIWLLPTLLLALMSIIDAEPWACRCPADPLRPGPLGQHLPAWLWDRQADWNARFTRGILAALYLVWVAQSFFLQRRMQYIHLPETLLMLGLWAAHRWAMPLILLLWLTVTSVLWLCADLHPGFHAELSNIAQDKWAAADGSQENFIIRHPLANMDRMRLWPKCWRCDLSPREEFALRDGLRLIKDFEASVGSEELDDVAQFLRAQGVKDRQVIAWHDSPHVIYLMLDIKPGIKFMHVSTGKLVCPEEVQEDLVAREGTARYAIADLELLAAFRSPDLQMRILSPPRSQNDLLPAKLPCEFRALFPYNQPVIFRSRGGLGRYTVHKLTPPFCDAPLPP
jgi:hypothetical protein